MRYGFEPSIQLYHTLFTECDKKNCDSLIDALFACDEKAFVEQLEIFEKHIGMPEIFQNAPYLVKAKRELTLEHIHTGARNIVFCSGMHVERTLKQGFVLQTQHEDAITYINQLFDLSKRVVDENTRKDMQLTASDALVSYFAAGICTR